MTTYFTYFDGTPVDLTYAESQALQGVGKVVYVTEDQGSVEVTKEIRTVSATGGEKGTKIERFDLIPVEPLRQLAAHYGFGARKYADRNWEKGYEWSKSYAALQRHAQAFWGGEDIDEESGASHMAGVLFHAMALLEFTTTMPNYDDRVKKDD